MQMFFLELCRSDRMFIKLYIEILTNLLNNNTKLLK